VPGPAARAGAAAPVPSGGQGGGLDPRTLWPDILDAVKNRRRFTWILLSQNAHVAGFDGTTLQVGFVNAGARDNFASSGSEDVLRQALAEQFRVEWEIEAIVDPGGPGGGAAPPPSGPGAPYQGAPRPPAQPPSATASRAWDTAAPARPAAPVQPPPPDPGPAGPPPGAAPPPAEPPAGARPAPRPAPSYTPPEDDIPEDDDPDLDESALSGPELIVRELGATVVEEYAVE
jgi:DNA polymerase-3 subunit gamma/tau